MGIACRVASPLLRSMRLHRDSRFIASGRGLIALLLFMAVPACQAHARPEARASRFITTALYETALLLERYGEIERASELAFQEIAANDSVQSEPAGLRKLRIRLLVKRAEYARADSLLSLEPRPEGIDDHFAYVLERAQLNCLSGRYGRALDLISSLDSLSSGLLDDYRAMLKMQIYAGRRDYASAVAAGEEVWRRGIPPSLSPAFEKTFLTALESEHRYPAALSVIGRLKNRYGMSDDLLGFIGREMPIYLAVGDTTRARKLAFDVASTHGTKKIALEYTRTALAIFPPRSLTEREAMQFCEVLLNHGMTGEARGILASLGEQPLTPQVRENLRFMHARALFMDRRFGNAVSLLQEEFSDPQISKQALLLTARAYRMMREYDKAADAYAQYGLAYPDSRLASETLYVASHLYDAVEDSARARDVRTRLASHYPNTYHGRRASLDLARASLRRRDYDDAVAILKRSVQRSSTPQEDVLYYLARAYEGMGMDSLEAAVLDRLREVDPRSFYIAPVLEPRYGLPALSSNGRVELVGNNGLLVLLKTLDERRRDSYRLIEEAIQNRPQNSRSVESSASYERAKLFIADGFLDWGAREAEAAFETLKRQPAALFALGKLCDEHALAWHSARAFDTLRLILSSGQNPLPKEVFDVFLYPVPFPGMIIEQCIRYKLPPHLAYAIIREESRFDVNAVSGAGAMGLMQIMPETGENVAVELGYPLRSVDLLLKPEINIAFGMSYAAHLLEECGGNEYMMLSAYNAGLGNARRWFVRTGEDASIQEQVDTIDYRETRAYVQRIIESSHVYASYFSRQANL